MAVKDPQEMTDLNQDVEIIRDILFGKNLKQLAKQLSALEDAVASLEGTIKSLKEEIRAENDRQAAVEERLDQALEDLDKQVVRQGKSLDSLRRDTSKKFKQMQGDIATTKAQQNNLIGSLANALASYQPEPAKTKPD